MPLWHGCYRGTRRLRTIRRRIRKWGLSDAVLLLGGIILEDLELASDRADQLAIELSLVRPELRAKDCAVRVTDGDDNELYRTPLDPVPNWKASRHLGPPMPVR
jgi:hypothetical protein